MVLVIGRIFTAVALESQIARQLPQAQLRELRRKHAEKNDNDSQH